MEYKTYKLGTCFSLIENGAIIKQRKEAKGFPITRIETLSHGKFNRDKLGHADIFDTTPYKRYILEDKDLIMSHINSRAFLGRTVLYRKKGNEQIIHGMNVLRIKTNEQFLDPVFASYLFKTSHFKKAIDSIRKDAINQSSINIFDICNIQISLPSITEQRKISHALQLIDKKIETNHLINDNLEAMAKQLYDYWFVQFDFPNEEGKPYKSSGGAMVWNEKLKREIPQGWNAANIFDELSVQYGFPFSTELFTEEPTNIPVVRIRDILENSVSAYSTEETDDKYKLQKCDLLIGMDGNFHMNYWNDNVSYLNQRSVRLRAKSNSTVSIMQTKYDIAPYIKAKELRAKGSTVGHLSDKDLKELFVLVSPNTDFRNKFDSILAEIIENCCEMVELTKQRDELLPLLMNGQASVNYHL